MQIPDHTAGQAGHQLAPEQHCIKSPGCPSRPKSSNASQQRILKVNTILGSTSKSVASKLMLCPLFGTSKTLPGGLCSVLDSPVQDGHWRAGMSLLEHQVAGAHDIHGEGDRKGVLLAEGQNKREIELFSLPVGNVQIRWSQTLLCSAPQ